MASSTVLILRVSAFCSRVRVGMTLTVACPWDWGRLLDGWTSPSVSTRCPALRSSAGLNSLSPSLTPGSCVAKTIFVKGVDGNTVVHRVHGHTVVGELLDCTDDVWVRRRFNLVTP